MNNLQIFKNNEFGEIRTITKDGSPWFVGRDVANVLQYANTNKAINDHVDMDDLTSRYPIIDSMGRTQEVSLINESGLYSLIISSKLPKAKEFKRWVTSEVLPTIRKTGGYVNNENTFINTYLPYADEQTKALFSATLQTVRSLNSRIEQDKPKVLFADAVTTAKTSILVGELAKLIKQNGVELGQQRLFRWLRDNGYLIRRNGTDYNMPTQKSMELGLFEIKETSVVHSDGHTSINKTPKVTGHGQQYFINRFLC